MSFTDDERKEIWNRTFGPTTMTAQDEYGAVIKKDAPADTEYAWEIDHIFPGSILRAAGVPEESINNAHNLRILHHSNNESKGDDYPTFRVNTFSYAGYNIPYVSPKTDTISVQKQKLLQALYYPFYLKLLIKNALYGLCAHERAAYQFMHGLWK